MEDPQTGGWSDAMTKILQMNVKSSNFILSKAKKDRDVVIDKQKSEDNDGEDLEVVGDDGNTRRIEEESDADDQDNLKNVNTRSKKTKSVKPERRSTWDRESELNVLATKGVVQLFNAVNQHRKMISSSLESTGKSERKRDKTLSKFSTDTFMDILSESKDGQEKVVKKKRFQDVLSEEVEETRITEWESDDSL